MLVDQDGWRYGNAVDQDFPDYPEPGWNVDDSEAKFARITPEEVAALLPVLVDQLRHGVQMVETRTGRRV